MAAAPTTPNSIAPRKRIGHEDRGVMASFGDDTDRRRRQSLNFIAVKEGVEWLMEQADA
jgi:hypothetical protein